MTYTEALEILVVAVPILANVGVALTRTRWPGVAKWIGRLGPLVLVALRPDREAKIAAMLEHAAALDPEHPIAELAREIRDGGL